MKSFKEWKEKSVSVKLGAYDITLSDIGNEKVLIKATSSSQIIDSKNEIKKILDFSELKKGGNAPLSLLSPTTEPMDTRNSYLPAT